MTAKIQTYDGQVDEDLEKSLKDYLKTEPEKIRVKLVLKK